jgi:NRPS condensation-like uncharacterized protein
MSKDALGKIFKVEKMLGRGDNIDFIFHYKNKSDVIKSSHHADYDGLGALYSGLAEEHQYFLPLPKRSLRIKGFWDMLAGLYGMLSDFTPSIVKWKKIEVNAKYDPRFRSWRVLSQPSTKALVGHLKSRNLSLNVYLLFLLNRVLQEKLIDSDETLFRWLFPVNMRETDADQADTSNHTSSIGLAIYKGDEVAEVQRMYERSVLGSRALATHFLAKVLASLPEKLLLKLAMLRGKKNMWVGTFSNVGRWDVEEFIVSKGLPEAISISPPAGTPCFPVGVGVITWGGQLSICMRLHPSIVFEDKIEEKILSEFIDGLRKESGIDLELSRTSLVK